MEGLGSLVQTWKDEEEEKERKVQSRNKSEIYAESQAVDSRVYVQLTCGLLQLFLFTFAQESLWPPSMEARPSLSRATNLRQSYIEISGYLRGWRSDATPPRSTWTSPLCAKRRHNTTSDAQSTSATNRSQLLKRQVDVFNKSSELPQNRHGISGSDLQESMAPRPPPAGSTSDTLTSIPLLQPLPTLSGRLGCSCTAM